MKRPELLCLLCLAISITGCRHYAYYQSPFHTNTFSYKAIPTQRDSTTSALYASGVLAMGGANDQLRDGFIGVLGSAHRSHSGRHLQGYYGITAGAGGYHVVPYRIGPVKEPFLNDSVINARSGSKFFGGVGANGGINLVIPFQKSEWRLIGVEACWMYEFGHYQRFRKQLPDSSASLIARSDNYLTLGINTEAVFYIPQGSTGFKLSTNWFPRKVLFYDIDQQPVRVSPGWWSLTAHTTKKRITASVQVNLGSHSMSSHFGFTYRLQ